MSDHRTQALARRREIEQIRRQDPSKPQPAAVPVPAELPADSKGARTWRSFTQYGDLDGEGQRRLLRFCKALNAEVRAQQSGVQFAGLGPTAHSAAQAEVFRAVADLRLPTEKRSA